MTNNGTAKDMLVADNTESEAISDYESSLLANEEAGIKGHRKDLIVIAGLFDDHIRHLKEHIKLFYKVRAWTHIVEHLILMRQKSKLGLNDITNRHIISGSFVDMKNPGLADSEKGNA